MLFFSLQIAIRRREDEIKQELIEADTRAQNELADLKKSLKGKDYSYDHKGDVVVTSKVCAPNSCASAAVKRQQPLPCVRVLWLGCV